METVDESGSKGGDEEAAMGKVRRLVQGGNWQTNKQEKEGETGQLGRKIERAGGINKARADQEGEEAGLP